MEPEEKEIDEVKVVGLTVKTTMKDAAKDCPKIWMEMMDKVKLVTNRVDEKIWYGPSKDTDEEGVDFISMAGVAVSDLDNVPSGMEGWVIPGGKYLVFTHKGKVEEIGKLWGYIYCEYKGEYNKKGMAFEYYDEQCKPDSEDSISYIYVPLE